jgi:hypothetical protein
MAGPVFLEHWARAGHLFNQPGRYFQRPAAVRVAMSADKRYFREIFKAGGGGGRSAQ